jgi:hypothetical protein
VPQLGSGLKAVAVAHYIALFKHLQTAVSILVAWIAVYQVRRWRGKEFVCLEKMEQSLSLDAAASPLVAD